MELERKDISQTFKVSPASGELGGGKLPVTVRRGLPQLEISELEEHKLQAEQEVKQLQEALEKLQLQRAGGGGGGGWSSEQERK